MDEFSEAMAPQTQKSPKSKSVTDEQLYSEEAVWLCENRKTSFRTRIHGALARILKQYPADYKLKLLSVKEMRHEHTTATD